ncbi:MAG: 4-hydroxybenzoate octaprenyltransferase [Rhodobacteraceae bacterium]|nr:MAG: 4-hydroxybenzoate octaprenyltransferase [Paracoccaceae bacterium]
MSDLEKKPAQVDGQVADATTKNWVDRYAPAPTRPYLRLSRADRPAGTWLLLLPCWWSLTLAMLANPAASTLYDLWLFIACAIGAFFMRGAGCTWNDISDREFDAQVERTKSRPLPSGQVTTKQAFIWLGAQLLVGLAVLLTLNSFAILLGAASLITVVIYPFAKRFTWWPQVFLGISFNWGALLGWAAHMGSLSWAPVLLYLAGICWTLFYDTIYAHQDTDDDELIGVKSTARLFGSNTPTWLMRFQIGSVALMTFALIFALLDSINMLWLVAALMGVWAYGWHLAWQLRRLDIENSDICLMLFRSNRDAGLIPVIAWGFLLILELFGIGS